MYFELIRLFVTITFLSKNCHGLFPYRSFDENRSYEELYLPNKWNSVNDCPVRYYEFGENGLVSPVDGKPAYDREFAHMAVIGWTNNDGSIVWNCGGSLISENFVLTAAHCTFWEGKPPDVVRMGDLNLENDTDNQHAQQRSISEIIKHPEYRYRYRYHDIALLRLNKPMKLHETVCPACLWNNSTVRFDYLEACGFGQIGYFERKTPKLLKVTLSPVDNQVCSESHPIDHKLDKGIVEHQICAVDRNFKMDTCLGDSGGPLQIKLLGNYRMNPFIIGITSFGKSCGTETPGVYTRVSSYVDWIESVTGIDTDPKVCAFIYTKFREYEPDIVTKIDDYERIETTKAHFPDIYNNKFLYLVDVGWSISKRNADWLCKGAIITENYVITSQICVTLKTSSPDIIRQSKENEVKVKIKKIHFHLLSVVDSGNKNNIALIQLASDIKFSSSIFPACLWNKPSIPKDMELHSFGVGSEKHQYQYYTADGPYEPDEKESLLVARSSMINYTYCNDYYSSEGVQINQESEMCYGNPEYYIVPYTCQSALGAPLERQIWPLARFFPYIMGINLFGNDCGFGFPAVFAKVSKYIEWIDSVIFGIQKEDGSKCILPDKRHGTCAKSSACLEIVKLVKEGKVAINEVICSFEDYRDPVVCCPEQKSEDKFNLAACPEKYLELRKIPQNITSKDSDESFSHIALIGKESQWVCYGSLISNKHVVTDFECMNPTLDHNAILLGGIKNDADSKIFEIAEVKSIPNSLTLIKLGEDVSFNSKILPACLWLDRSKIPFYPVFVPSPISARLKSKFIRPFQNLVCKNEFNQSSLLDDQSCFKSAYDKICVTKGSPVQWNRRHFGKIIPYVVGVVSQEIYTCRENNEDGDENEDGDGDENENEDENNKDVHIFTRIAHNIDWINQNL